MSEIVIVKAGGGEAPVTVQGGMQGPSFVRPGTGGKMIRHKNGTVVGPIAGEALRFALARGAEIISDEGPAQTFHKPVGTGPQAGLNLK